MKYKCEMQVGDGKMLKQQNELLTFSAKARVKFSLALFQIPLPSVAHGGFLGFLQYVYTDEVNLDVHDALDVLTVANQFCLPRLVSLCEVWLEKKMELSLHSSKRKSDRTGELVDLIVTAQVNYMCLIIYTSLTMI